MKFWNMIRIKGIWPFLEILLRIFYEVMKYFIVAGNTFDIVNIYGSGRLTNLS